MQAINPRNLLPVLGTKIIVLLFLLSGSTQLDAQKFRGNYNFLDFQQKPYYFGITLGYNTSTFRPFQSRDFLRSDSIAVVEGLSGPGFNLGIVTNLKIGDYFDFRFLPTLSFAERELTYDRRSRLRPTTRTVFSVCV